MESLPEGVSIQIENVSVGPGRTEMRRHARMVPVGNESLEQARARLAAWAEHIAVPAGDHLALARVSEYDEDQDRLQVIGWRTYLLKAQAEVTGADVVDAMAMPDTDPDHPGILLGAHVAVELNAAGAARLAAFTRANVKRRLAIVVEGTVESAPLILSEIPGPHLQISMGQGNPEEQFVGAKQLAQALRGE